MGGPVEHFYLRLCPDCHDTGFWYPEGLEKGVAKCKHTKLSPIESYYPLLSDEAKRVLERTARELGVAIYQLAHMRKRVNKASMPPQFGERILLLILNKDERINIPGDLEEEFAEIATKHGARFAKTWYYKQVAASAWPLIRKGIGWGVLASVGEWIRRII